MITTKKQSNSQDVVIIAIILAATCFWLLGLYDVFGAEIVNNPLRIRTEEGINIIVPLSAASQYEEHWELEFLDIEWDKIDTIYKTLAVTYGVEFKPDLKIRIVSWNPNCTDENGDPDSKEFGFACIDGIYSHGAVTIHLGDDPAQGERAWCNTALNYEIWHHLAVKKRDFCGISQNEFTEYCQQQFNNLWLASGLCR